MYLKDAELSPKVEGKAEIASKVSTEIKENNPMVCIDLTKDSKSQDSDEGIESISPPVKKSLQLVLYNEHTGNAMKIVEPMSPTEKRSLIQMNRLWNYLPELKNFTLFRKIGEGTFSSVYLACLKGNPEKKYAIKHHVPTSLPSRIAWEFKCLKDIGGVDNVAGIDTAFRRNDCTVFVMPYMPHTRFSEYVLAMGVAETREYLRNLLLALARVHSFGVIHRDVKPSNYLYDREARRYMLVDFGLSCLSLEPDPVAMPTPVAAKRKRVDSPDATQPKRRALQTQPNGGAPVRPTNGKPATRTAANQVAAKRRTDRSPAARKPSLADRRSSGQGLTSLQAAKGSFVWSKPSNGKGGGADEAASPRREAATESVRKKLFAPRAEDEAARLADQSANHTQGQKGAAVLNSKENQSGVPCDTDPQPPTAPRKTVLGTVDANAGAADGHRFTALAAGTAAGARHVRVQDSKTLSALEQRSPPCGCYGKGRVCTMCLSRPGRHVPRAGTPGFRPPEVLFKYPHQTTAVDVWAAGVVMLCVMSGCYPFFKSPNDMMALAEITVVFGSDKIKEIASKLGRQVLFTASKRPLSLRRLCESLRNRNRGRRPPSPTHPVCSDCMQFLNPDDGCLCGPEPATPAPEDDDAIFPPSAYDLLTQLMDLNPFTRISAAEALKHPFFTAGKPEP